MQERDIRPADLGLLCLLMGTLTTVVFYHYGVSNHINELPILMRAIDSDFLAQDFYTNSAAGRGPRYFFARFIACFASLESLPYVTFAFAWLSNVAIAAVTALTARSWFGGSSLAGAIAAALVMSVSTFEVGFTRGVFTPQLLASHAAAPFIFLALFAAFERRPFLTALSSGVAALFHVTFGLESGVVALALCGLGIYLRDRSGPRDPSSIPSLLLAVSLFAGLGLLSAWLSLPDGRADGADFVAIETLFRHPHHSLLGAQATGDLLRGALFGLGSVVALWVAHRVFGTSRVRTIVGLCLVVGLLVGVPLAALLFEVMPERLLAVARPMRLLFLLKWFGLLMVGGLLALSWQSPPLDVSESRPSRRVITAGILVFLALVVVPSSRLLICLGTSGVAIIGLWLLRHHAAGLLWLRVASLALPVALLAQLFFGEQLLPEAWVSRIGKLRPTLTLDALGGDEADIARRARRVTPEDAIFVTPPDMGVFRMIAERGVVVDYKAFPFGDLAMIEWRTRLARCYGEATGSGLEVYAELGARYRSTAPESLAAQGCDYGASFAVIEHGTRTSLPVVAENASYRIVALP